jgi:hypothetical protein
MRGAIPRNWNLHCRLVMWHLDKSSVTTRSASGQTTTPVLPISQFPYLEIAELRRPHRNDRWRRARGVVADRVELAIIQSGFAPGFLPRNAITAPARPNYSSNSSGPIDRILHHSRLVRLMLCPRDSESSSMKGRQMRRVVGDAKSESMVAVHDAFVPPVDPIETSLLFISSPAPFSIPRTNFLRLSIPLPPSPCGGRNCFRLSPNSLGVWGDRVQFVCCCGDGRYTRLKLCGFWE